MPHGEVLQVSKGQDVLFVQFFMGAQKMMAPGCLQWYTAVIHTVIIHTASVGPVYDST